MRKLLFPGCSLLWMISLCVLVDADDSSPKRLRPNVVVLLADDLGWRDLGCYEGPVDTPVLDELATQGTRFTDFYAGAAVCSPSRAVLLTGKSNVRCGIFSWINDHDQRTFLPRSEVTLAEILQDAGYQTGHFGKWHLGMPTQPYPEKPTPSDHGFDYWFATANNATPSHLNPKNFIRNGESLGVMQGYACDVVVDESIAWLAQIDIEQRPFFLNVWFHEPHAPLAAPTSLVEQYGESDDPAAVYSATIANTDQAIGRLLDQLRRMGVIDDTVVIYASDNGSYRKERVGMLRGTKGSNYEGGLRVPGIFSWPGHIRAGIETDVPAGLVDLLPTICGLVGISRTEFEGSDRDGCDLSPMLLRGEPAARQKPLYWLLPLSGPAAALRDGRYGMVAYRRGEIPRDHAMINHVKSEIKNLLTRKGILELETRGSTFERQLFEGFSDLEAERLRGKFIRLNQFHEAWIPELKKSTLTRFELYDLVHDPQQTNELSARYPLIHHRLKVKLQDLVKVAFKEAHDWSLGNPKAIEDANHIHRFDSDYQSLFDAFTYVNRIPTAPAAGEDSLGLAGRILGRLANQEGRVLIKLPPGMERAAYDGFKRAVTSNTVDSPTCISCHAMPSFSKDSRSVPSLRNKNFTPRQFRKALASDTHQAFDLSEPEIVVLHEFQKTLRDQPKAAFRSLILKAKVLDTTGDTE